MSFLRALMRRARSGDQGAVAVEAAIITPVLLLIIFGIIDFGLLIKDDVAIVSAARSISRTASIQAPIQTNGVSGPMTPKDQNGVGPTFFGNIANQAQVATAGMTRNSNTYLYIYIPGKASPGGGGVCSASDCVVYQWNGTAFTYFQAGSWNSADVDACAADGTNMTQVGITVETIHTVFTPVFKGNVTLSETSILYFEPVPTQPAPGCQGK